MDGGGSTARDARRSAAPAAHLLPGGTSATTALGAFLSAGNHHAAGTSVGGVTNSVPSNSSRYFSVDFGLVHLVALSLNGYNAVDACTTACNEAQLKWLKEDLAAVDRKQTPWVIGELIDPSSLLAAFWTRCLLTPAPPLPRQPCLISPYTFSSLLPTPTPPLPPPL